MTKVIRSGITVRALQDIVKKYVSLAGLESHGISAHKLRHTSATLMYKYGRVDIRSGNHLIIEEHGNRKQCAKEN